MEDIQVGRYNGGFAMARKVGMGNSHRIGPAISISLYLVPELTPSLLPSLVKIPERRSRPHRPVLSVTTSITLAACCGVLPCYTPLQCNRCLVRST